MLELLQIKLDHIFQNLFILLELTDMEEVMEENN